MQYIISGKNIDVTEGLKEAIYEKIGKLERYFTPETEVHVTTIVCFLSSALLDAEILNTKKRPPSSSGNSCY